MTAIDRQKLGRITDTKNSTIPLLGYMCWWNLRGVQISRGDLLTRLAASGLDAAAPDPPSDQKALRRAIEAWVRSRRAQGDPALGDDDDESDEPHTTRALIRPINHKKSTYIVFALVGEHVDFTQLGLQYGTSARILLEKLEPKDRALRQPTLLCTTEEIGLDAAVGEATRITSEIKPFWATFSNLYLAGDLGQMMKDIMTTVRNAISLHRRGGVYFIPAQEARRAHIIQQFVEQLPSDGVNEPYYLCVPIIDEPRARQELAHGIQLGFKAELDAMEKKLADLQSKSKHIGQKTIATKLAEYQATTARAKVYADLLGMQQEQIVERIAEIRRKAKSLLSGGDDLDMDDTNYTPAPQPKPPKLPKQPKAKNPAEDIKKLIQAEDGDPF